VEGLQAVQDSYTKEEKTVAIRPEEISEIINSQITDFEAKVQTDEVGCVIKSGDGIATIYGLDNCMSGELIDFGDDVYGMAMNLEEESIGCVLLGGATQVKEGTVAKRTGKSVSIPVGDEVIGRVIDPLGRGIDGKGDIKVESYRDIEFWHQGLRLVNLLISLYKQVF
jgi:F-type H+-transporting ATPase subunit alpha